MYQGYLKLTIRQWLRCSQNNCSNDGSAFVPPFDTVPAICIKSFQDVYAQSDSNIGLIKSCSPHIWRPFDFVITGHQMLIWGWQGRLWRRNNTQTKGFSVILIIVCSFSLEVNYCHIELTKRMGPICKKDRTATSEPLSWLSSIYITSGPLQRGLNHAYSVDAYSLERSPLWKWAPCSIALKTKKENGEAFIWWSYAAHRAYDIFPY